VKRCNERRTGTEQPVGSQDCRVSAKPDDDLSDLMRAGLGGNAAAYRRVLQNLARTIQPRVRRVLGQAGRGSGEVEDVVQEVLLAVHTKRHTWDAAQPLAPWVAAITRHKLIDHLRRRGMHGHVPLEDLADTLPETATVDAGRTVDRARLLASLPDRQRQIVEAMTIEGHSARAVGDALGMSEGAVRVALHRALKALAERMRESGS
jgi:RNA polymerase sigma-70 factor (ECF subfamily)